MFVCAISSPLLRLLSLRIYLPPYLIPLMLLQPSILPSPVPPVNITLFPPTPPAFLPSLLRGPESVAFGCIARPYFASSAHNLPSLQNPFPASPYTDDVSTTYRPISTLDVSPWYVSQTCVRNPQGLARAGGITHVSAPNSRTAWTTSLKNIPDTLGLYPSIPSIIGRQAQLFWDFYRFPTTSNQSSSKDIKTQPKYLKDVTISIGLP